MTVQEWLGKDNQLGIDIWSKKYQFENETFDEWIERVSGGDTAVEEHLQHLLHAIAHTGEFFQRPGTADHHDQTVSGITQHQAK